MAITDKHYSPIYKGKITGQLYFEERPSLSIGEASTKLNRSLDQPEIYSVLRENEYISQKILEVCELVGVKEHVKQTKPSKEEELPGLSRSRTNKVSTKKAVKK